MLRHYKGRLLRVSYSNGSGNGLDAGELIPDWTVRVCDAGYAAQAGVPVLLGAHPGGTQLRRKAS